jgi:hypothetical protein
MQHYGSAGLWAECLVDFGFNCVGVAVPNMAVSDLEEVDSRSFPRKVTLDSPEEA